MKKKFKKGFSLVEMLVVVAIIGILSTVLYTSYTKYVTQSKKAVAKAEALEIMEVFQTAMVDHQTAYKGDEVEIDNYTTFEELVTLDMKEAYLDAIAKQGGGGGTGDGDMKKAVYDNDLAVLSAGGIKAFVNGVASSKQDTLAIDNEGYINL